ncbi:MAG: EAL domain-containing protein [Inhella sp.]
MTQEAIFGQRRRWTLQLSAWLALLASLGFVLSLLALGQPERLLGPGLGALGALAVLALLQRGHGRAAAWVCILALALCVVVLGLWVDVPLADAPEHTPRSVHLYLLPLTLMAYLLLVREPALLRLACCAGLLGLLAWLTLQPNPLGITPALAEAERARLVVAAPLLSALLLAGIVHLRSAGLDDQSRFELDLARAIAEEQLELHYQPQCDAQGRALGVEALVRWRHPVQGPISPARFVPLAERNGLIVPLGELVLRQACRFAQDWQAQPGARPLQVAVNVSALQLAEDAGLERLLELVRQHRLPPQSIKFELTESVLADQPERLRRLLARCREQGVCTSLDDFGTGYASLAYLGQLPFDQLKIDQSFVRALGSSERALEVARTVVQLGQRLGMEVIAEGVETEAQREQLLAMGCARFQGYLFARPLPAGECRAWLQAHA